MRFTMQITVTRKSVYGNILVYPVCEQAQRFCSMLGSKTLTARDLRHIADLGFVIHYTASL